MEGQQDFLQNGDTTELCFVMEQRDRIFLVKKKKKKSVSCYFQFILLFSKRLISYDLKKEDDHSLFVRRVRKHCWKSTQQKEGPVMIKDALEFFLYLRISTIPHSKLLWSDLMRNHCSYYLPQIAT